jgi:glycosyltransferase involved in cell wall biosynthesis
LPRRYKLAALVSHPIQYQVPLFRALAAHPEIDLHVFFCSRTGAERYMDVEFGVDIKWDIPLDEGYPHSYLPNWSPKPHVVGFAGLINPAIVSRVLFGGFDALWIHGWSHVTDWLAALSAMVRGVPLFLRGDTNVLREPAGFRRLIKRFLLGGILFRSASGFLTIGTRNREFYKMYGVNSERVFPTPYAVDNEFFQNEASALAPKKRELKDSEKIDPDLPVVLFSGKLIDLKRPMDLLEAFARARRNVPASLVWVGDGALRPEMEKFIREHDVPNVHFLGFRNQRELPACYAMADVFVLPSGAEAWGLVVNEAMCFGLPLVLSDRVGAAVDMVEEGRNGFVYPVGDVNTLAARLETLLRDEQLRLKMGSRSLALIGQWGIKENIEGVLQALRHTAGGAGPA